MRANTLHKMFNHKKHYLTELMPLEQLIGLFAATGEELQLRELCFVTLEQQYQRYLSFPSVQKLREQLCARAFHLRELHIGAEYNVPCSLRAELPLEPRGETSHGQ